KPHLGSKLHAFEAAIDHAVRVEIDLTSIRRLEVTVAGAEELDHTALRHRFVRLHSSPSSSRMVLQAAPCCVESCADCDFQMLLLRASLHLFPAALVGHSALSWI